MWIGVCFVFTDTLNCQVIGRYFRSSLLSNYFSRLFLRTSEWSFVRSLCLFHWKLLFRYSYKGNELLSVDILNRLFFAAHFRRQTRTEPINRAFHQMFVFPFEIERENIGIWIESLPTYLKDYFVRTRQLEINGAVIWSSLHSADV